MEQHDWIAICAHQLQRHWRTVAPEQLEEVAYELWRDARLQALPPRDAATDFLRPLTSAPPLPEAPVTAPVQAAPPAEARRAA